MKKALILCFVMILASFSAFSADELNYEKIYAIDDEIVSDMKDLYILSGYSLPSTTGPYSGSEMKMALSRLDYDALSEAGKRLYDRIDMILTSDAESAVFTGDVPGLG